MILNLFLLQINTVSEMFFVVDHFQVIVIDKIIMSVGVLSFLCFFVDL